MADGVARCALGGVEVIDDDRCSLWGNHVYFGQEAADTTTITTTTTNYYYYYYYYYCYYDYYH